MIKIPTNPDDFFDSFIPTTYQQVMAGRKLPDVPYKVTVSVGSRTWLFGYHGGKLEHRAGAKPEEGDIRVSLTEEDFSELVRAARSNAPEELPEPPPVPPTYQFPDIQTLKGCIRSVIDDLGDKRTVDVIFGDAPAGKPTATVHTTVDFIVGLQGKTLAVDQILKAGGVKVEGDFSYVLRVANALTGKTRRRER